MPTHMRLGKAEHHVELGVAEHEMIALVDQSDVDRIAQGLGQQRGKLKPAEPGPQN
ncbi:MAG: hypothetical protein ACKVP4_12070 [Hyphomicrobium sp.]